MKMLFSPCLISSMNRQACQGHPINMSVKTELLQEKAEDLERVKRYAGAEQIDTIIGKVKEQERMERQAIQYHRSYGAR